MSQARKFSKSPGPNTASPPPATSQAAGSAEEFRLPRFEKEKVFDSTFGSRKEIQQQTAKGLSAKDKLDRMVQ
jgi:hypothetical protein